MNGIVENEIIPKYNIVYSPKVELLTFPLTINGIVYGVDLEVKTRPANEKTDFTSLPVILSYRLNITRSGTGKKTIRAADVESQRYESIYILGALKSPFEDKMAVLYTFNYCNYSAQTCRLGLYFKIYVHRRLRK